MFNNAPLVTVHRSPAAPSSRPFLVFVRAGANPRAQKTWLLSGERGYDIMASFYAQPAADCWLLEAADYVTSGGLSKFHAAKLLLQPGLIERYAGVWMIDDDIQTHFEPGAFLEFVASQQFALAQPALTHDSFASFPITLVHPTCIFRETNFVEVMAPYFAKSLLAEAIVDFDRSISSWGLDIMWGAKYTARRLAIVDAFAMTHTGAVDVKDGPFYRYLRGIGIDPWAEMAQAFQHLGLERYDIVNQRFALRTYPMVPPSIPAAPMPSDAQTHLELADKLSELGRYAEAVTRYRQALRCKPDFAEAHNNLGNALLQLGQVAEAASSYRAALATFPDSPEALNNLGGALHGLGRLDEAAASYRRALEIKPNFAKAHINLGNVFRSQGRASDAEASCHNALTLDPDSAPTLVLLAELRADKGQFGEACALLERAVAIEPRNPQAWAGMARWRTMTHADTAWLAQAQQIADSGLPPHTEVLLRYAIGKYFADVKAFGAAFTNYQRANELEKFYKPKHDRGLLTQTVDLLIRSYDRQWLSRARNEALGSERPVFIVGMPRSGTTLAEQILASHPAVLGAGELPFWQMAVGARELSVFHTDASHDALHRLADDYLQLLQTLSPDALRVSDKMPGNFMFLGLIHAALPRARIIHMQRDPIDTCLSIYFQHFESSGAYTNDLEDLAHYYTEYSRLMSHWRAILPADTMLEVPYEELVEDQEAWSRKLLEFIGLPWDARCLDFHQTERAVLTASNWQVRQRISKGSVGRWRGYADYVGPLLSLARTA